MMGKWLERMWNGSTTDMRMWRVQGLGNVRATPNRTWHGRRFMDRCATPGRIHSDTWFGLSACPIEQSGREAKITVREYLHAPL